MRGGEGPAELFTKGSALTGFLGFCRSYHDQNNSDDELWFLSEQAGNAVVVRVTNKAKCLIVIKRNIQLFQHLSSGLSK